MFLIVKLLGAENAVHLIWNSGVGVVAGRLYLVEINELGEGKTYPRSGPTSLFPVVNTLDAAHPET